MTRVEIQQYKVVSVKHWRARIEGEENYKFEIYQNENLDQFRWRIMDFLKTGVCFLFQPDWELKSNIASIAID